MSEPKRMSVYQFCLSDAQHVRELWYKIPEGEIVCVSPSEQYSFDVVWANKVIERFNRDPLIGLIYSDIQINIGENYYTEFLNDDNRISQNVPVFIAKRSNIDISECTTTPEVFGIYISNGQRVEHLAETLFSCSELAYDNKIHQGN